jgi:hypothetical protein
MAESPSSPSSSATKSGSTSRCPVPATGPRADAGGLAGFDPPDGPGGDFGDAVPRRGLESPVFEAVSAMVASWMGFDRLQVSTQRTFTSRKERLSIAMNRAEEVD